MNPYIVSKQGIKGPDIMINMVWANTILGVQCTIQ